MKFEVRRAEADTNDAPLPPEIVEDAPVSPQGAPTANPGVLAFAPGAPLAAPIAGAGGHGDARALLPWLDDVISHLVLPVDPGAPAMAPGDPLPAPKLPPAVPLANPDDLKARADRMKAEQMLDSKRLETGEDASKAVDILVDIPGAQRTKAIDQLDDKAFENLLERVPEKDREKIAALVDASHDPKRKLRMWAIVHEARASNDLDRYRGDFGGEQPSAAQTNAKQQFERRERGVESDASEVSADVQALLDKPDLSLADVDALRARKDRELAVEMKYNLYLTAQKEPGFRHKHVQWDVGELDTLDLALSEIPSEHLRDPKMVESISRISAEQGLPPRGEYKGTDVPLRISDGAMSTQNEPAHYGDRSLVSAGFAKTHGAHSAPLEEVSIHEIGHNVADEKPEVFDKFKAVSHFRENLNEADIRTDGATDADVKKLKEIRRQASTDLTERNTDANKVFSPNNVADKDTFSEMDATAVPANQARWDYGGTNARELWAEMYAQAILTPEALYGDFVAGPTKASADADAMVADDTKRLADLQKQNADAAAIARAQHELTAARQAAATAQLAKKQQGEEFAIMRNDVFHTDTAKNAAEARLLQAGAPTAKLAIFRDRAEHASTPAQIAELEREAKE